MKSMQLSKMFRSKGNEVDRHGYAARNEDRYDMDQYLKGLEEKRARREEEEDLESYSKEKLQEMSMPKLWQKASNLGISREGDRDQLIDRILNAQKERKAAPEETFAFEILEQLTRARDRLKEFEKTREGIRTQIESMSELAPKLNERKDLLEKEIHEKETKVAEITELIPKLEGKKEELQKDVRRRQEQKELLEKEIHEKETKVAEITELIPKLNRNIVMIRDSIELKQKKISRIEEQVRQILEMQNCDIGLVSTLVYTEMLSEKK